MESIMLWSQLCIIEDKFGIEIFSCGQYEKLVNQMLTNRKSVFLEHFDMFFKFIVLWKSWQNWWRWWQKLFIILGPLIIEDRMTVKVLRMKNLVTLVTLLNNFFSKALPHMDHILHSGTGNFEVCWLYPAPH